MSVCVPAQWVKRSFEEIPMNYFTSSIVLLTISFVCEVYFRVIRARQNRARATYVDGSFQENFVKGTMAFWGMSVLLYGLEVYPYTVLVTLPVVLRDAGLIGMLLAPPLSIWIHRSLGKQFSQNLQIFDGHTLVRHGPYRYVRHPMYATFMLFALSACAATASAALMGVTFVCITLLLRRIAREEKMLVVYLGEGYRAYQEQTGTLLPRVRF